MRSSVCRWGILGTAGIARKNWLAIRNSGNGRLVAVASRALDRSRQFIAECQPWAVFDPAPEPVGSYDDLLTRPDVDAIYIPLPTGLRKQWVIKAADAGKHVLVEKPVGCTAADVEEMLAACRRNGVQFMDGVMFMHSQRLNQLRSVLDDGQSVGQIRRITTLFSFLAPEEFHRSNIRAHSELEPLGCLGDLGWYNVRFTLWAMKYQMPLRVSARLLSQRGRADSPTAVPMEFSAELLFPGDVSASFYCSFLTENQQVATISGTKGFATLRDFVLPFYGSEVEFHVTNAAFQVRGCDFNMEDHTRRHAVSEYSNSGAESQETRLFRRFGELVLSRTLDDSWGQIALQTQQVLDACLESARHDGRTVTM